MEIDMTDRHIHVLTYEVSEQEIRAALGVKHFCADYNGNGNITSISLHGQTMTPSEVMERVDAEREARHGRSLLAA
jgi:hypothetical protein